MEKKQTNLLILLCFLVYVSACTGKYCFSSNVTLVESVYGVTHAQTGLISTMFFFAYGIGQVVNGIFCKYYNKRILITSSLLISTIINMLIFTGISFEIIKYLWLVNGIVQSFLWPSLIYLLSKSLGSNSLSKAVVVMGATTATGRLISIGSSAVFSLTQTYKWAFLFSACFMCTVAILWIILYRNRVTENATASATTADNKIQKTEKKELSFFLLIGTIAVFGIAVNLVYEGLNSWVPSILKETFELTDGLSIILSVVLPLLTIFAGMFAVFMHRLIKNFIFELFVNMLVCAGLVFGVMQLLNTEIWILVVILFGCIVFLMSACNNIITSIAPMYMRSKINSGALAGILNGFCYVGSTISAYGLGAVADNGGWNSVFTLLLIVALAISLIAGVYLIVNGILSRKKNENPA